MVKGFSVLMYSPNPPHYFICSPNQKEVVDTNTAITAKSWTAYDIDWYRGR